MSDPYECIEQMQQELERLRNENAALRRELYPPESPKKELKYWIVTGLSGTTPIAEATDDWHKVLRTKLYLASNGFTSINILEQRVLI